MAKYTAEAYEWGGGQIAIYALGEGLVPAFSTLHVYPEQAAADFAAIHNGSDPVEDGWDGDDHLDYKDENPHDLIADSFYYDGADSDMIVKEFNSLGYSGRELASSVCGDED